MKQALEQPCALKNGQVGKLSASIGIALCPSTSKDAVALLAAAEEAMCLAKAHGKASYAFTSADVA